MKFTAILFCLLFTITVKSQTKLFLVAGQSNAVGVGNSDSSIQYQDPACFEYFTNGTLKPLKDPVGYTTEGEDFQAAVTGSAWPAFADTYHQLSGDSVIIVQAAKGGTSCHASADAGAGNWSSSYHLFDQAVDKVFKAEGYTGLQVAGIVWLQGESDAIGIAQGRITACQYKAALQDLISRFRKSLRCNVPFYIIETGLYTDKFDAQFYQVRTMQQQVATEDPLTFIVDSSADTYRSLGWMMPDQIHLAQNALNRVGANTANSIYSIEHTVNLDSCYTIPIPLSQPDWSVFPSPFKDELTIQVRNFSCADLDVQIFDLKGRKVYQENKSCTGMAPVGLNVNTAKLNRGVYIIHVLLNKQWTFSQKMVKE